MHMPAQRRFNEYEWLFQLVASINENVARNVKIFQRFFHTFLAIFSYFIALNYNGGSSRGSSSARGQGVWVRYATVWLSSNERLRQRTRRRHLSPKSKCNANHTISVAVVIDFRDLN